MESLTNQISALKFDTEVVLEKGPTKSKTEPASRKAKKDERAADKLEEAKLVFEALEDNLSKLNTTYNNLLSELGPATMALSKNADKGPLDFKDTFYRTQALIVNEASRAGCLISDRYFGFERYETQLPRKEELDILFTQLEYVRDLILLMIKTDMKAIKTVQLVPPREIKSKNFQTTMLKEYESKFLLECPTYSLVNFLLDINKLDSLFVVNDIKVETKKDASKLILVDVDISAIELVTPEAENQPIKRKTPSDSQAMTLYNILFKRDIFNRFERIIEGYAESSVTTKERVAPVILPDYRGLIELPDGTLIAQVNFQNRTYFVEKGDKFLDYMVDAITKESLELTNLKTSKTLILNINIKKIKILDIKFSY
ncbi:MAG: hypothetical protein FJZ16_09630 [Candidatus Omnitrophica bacterium]|nr:hypothetical protein [Candidatus Omnitrophota bacterium]